MRKLFVGLPVAVVVVVLGLMLTPFCATCGGHDEALTELMRRCKRATDLLGEDLHPARMGLACGSTEVSGDRGNASWSLAYTGEKGRGSVDFSAEKRLDTWKIQYAVLEVDGETIDLVACAPGAPTSGARLAQTNADGVTGSFDGKVARSSHPTIAVGFTCTGSLARERGSATATVKVTCAAATDAEAVLAYDGKGAFTLDVGDASRREDDRFEYDDSTGSPSCRLSASGGKGTLTVWSKQAWEIVVDL